jgi:hypothetical protein
LPILYLVGVTRKLIGHAAPVYHAQLVGRNSNGMSTGIIIEDDGKPIVLIQAAKGIDFLSVIWS